MNAVMSLIPQIWLVRRLRVTNVHSTTLTLSMNVQELIKTRSVAGRSSASNWASVIDIKYRNPKNPRFLITLVVFFFYGDTLCSNLQHIWQQWLPQDPAGGSIFLYTLHLSLRSVNHNSRINKDTALRNVWLLLDSATRVYIGLIVQAVVHSDW